MKTTEPKEPKASRKQPERNPVRHLFLERGRFEFAISEFDKKIALEESRHKAKIESLGMERAEMETHLEKVKAELKSYGG